jgi:AraC-like DNA-binding protein
MSRRLLKHSFSLLHVDYVKLNNNWNFSNIISPYYRLYYIDEGEGYIYNSENKILLEAGYLYIIPSFTLCNLSCKNYLSQYFIQFFEDSPDGISLFTNNRKFAKIKANHTDVEKFKRILNINPGRGINHSDNPKVYEKNNYYREYQELNKLQNIANYMETQGILLQLISRFLTPETYQQKNINAIPSKILDAISYIQVNLNKNLTVVHLAERANQNKDYFSRVFHQYTGERPITFINDKRIERAQYLLTTTNKSYLDIAEETGFENLPYFSRIFKKITGITPGLYKKQNSSLI